MTVITTNRNLCGPGDAAFIRRRKRFGAWSLAVPPAAHSDDACGSQHLVLLQESTLLFLLAPCGSATLIQAVSARAYKFQIFWTWHYADRGRHEQTIGSDYVIPWDEIRRRGEAVTIKVQEARPQGDADWKLLSTCSAPQNASTGVAWCVAHEPLRDAVPSSEATGEWIHGIGITDGFAVPFPDASLTYKLQFYF